MAMTLQCEKLFFLRIYMSLAEIKRVHGTKNAKYKFGPSGVLNALAQYVVVNTKHFLLLCNIGVGGSIQGCGAEQKHEFSKPRKAMDAGAHQI
jgi:hypothetical protein